MNWTCPYCGQHTTITEPNKDYQLHHIYIKGDKYSDDLERGLGFLGIACPNSKCKELTLIVNIEEVEYEYSTWVSKGNNLNKWQLLPESSAKPQPGYIPKQIIEDYTEACRIKDLSPKASATLSRRCLQGMIRDFWRIDVPSKKLYDEITALEDKVSYSEWEAIDALRSMGNIGAHMKQDVNIIVYVEPEEADLLIEFIEGLFKDWYVNKHDRDERNKRLKELAISKGEKPRDSKAKSEEKK